MIGDVVVVLECRLKHAKQSPRLVPVAVENNDAWELVPAQVEVFLKEHYGKDNYRKYCEVREYFWREFTRTIEAGSEHEYRITIAIAEWVLSNSNTDGILYPSIATEGYRVNVALKPQAADTLYQFMRAKMYIVVEKPAVKESGHGNFRYVPMAEAHAMQSDGTLLWKPAESENFKLNL